MNSTHSRMGTDRQVETLYKKNLFRILEMASPKQLSISIMHLCYQYLQLSPLHTFSRK